MSNFIDSATRPVEVTVLLPAYNEEQSIGNTIREIKQLYSDYEILVVNDGSTDRTKEEAVKAAREKLILYGGIGAASLVILGGVVALLRR